MPYDSSAAHNWAAPIGTHVWITSKRKEARQRVLLRAQIHVVQVQHDLMVTDISRGGLRGSSDISLRVGQSVYISLDDLTHVAGSIRWIQHGRFGMKFFTTLDMLPECAVVEKLDQPGHRPRMPRKPAQLKAKISLANWSSPARIRNVSKTGMMIETELMVIAEQKLLITLSDGKIFDAVVKWTEGDRVGIELATPASILQFTYGGLT